MRYGRGSAFGPATTNRQAVVRPDRTVRGTDRGGRCEQDGQSALFITDRAPSHRLRLACPSRTFLSRLGDERSALRRCRPALWRRDIRLDHLCQHLSPDAAAGHSIESGAVFTQLRGLGMSATSRKYGLSGLAEARAYVAHPVLGPRMREATAAMLSQLGAAAEDVLSERRPEAPLMPHAFSGS